MSETPYDPPAGTTCWFELSSPDPAAAPELVYQDFYDEDGDLLRCLWRDPVTGSELEMEPCGAWIAEAELDALISHLEAQAADLLAAV